MKLTKKTAFVGAFGLGALGTSQVDADVIYTNMNNGQKETAQTNTYNAQDDQALQDYNSTVEQLKAEFSFIRVSEQPVTGDLRVKKQELDALKPTLRQLQSLRAQIRSIQKQAAQSGVVTTAGSTTRADETTLKQKMDDYNSAITTARNTLRDIPNITLDSSLAGLIFEANEQIMKASEINNHVEDGIRGNLDDVHRASYDSSQPGTVTSKKGPKTGVVVTTDKTTRANVVTSEQDIDSSVATTASDIIAKRDAILTKIANSHKENEREATKAGVYKDNALRNIASINKWLQKEQDRADNIQNEINNNMTAVKEMEKIKADANAQFTKVEQLIRNSGKSQKTINKVLDVLNNAKQKMSESTITQRKTDTINVGQNIDFGDIGRDESTIKAVQDQASSNISSRVDTALEKLRRSNTDAQAKIDAWKGDTTAKIKEFVDKLEAGKMGGGQVDEDWLRTRSIYNTNHGGYQNFIKAALAQTEEDTKGVLTKQGNTWIVANGTPTPKAAAALYNEKSAQGLEEGFGSVMLPSANINDFATVEGNKLANSQSFSGGAQGILDYMGSKPRMTFSLSQSGKTYFSDTPVVRDIMDQHIKAVGNDKVFLVVSKKPSATFKLRDSFLYANEQGEFKTTDMTVKLTVGDGSGNNLGEQSVNGGRTHMFYFFYMSVDAATGKLVTGGGWFLAYDQSANTGNMGNSGSGTGELAIQGGSESDSSDSTTLQDYMSKQRYFFPTNNTGNPYNTVGLSLTVDVKVNSAAGAYATNSPLYIADIDDGQAVNTGGDVVISNSSHPSTSGGSYVLSNTVSTGAHNGHVNLDAQAIMTTENGPVRISKTGTSVPYQAIDIALFSPWGIIGGQPPKLDLGTVNHEVETFDIADPNAIAHTEGDYHVKKISGSLRTNPDSVPNTPIELPNIQVDLKKAVSDAIRTETKQTASATSIIVRRLADNINKVGSGNSLVIRQLDSLKKAGSGNTLVVKQIEQNKKAGSGNTLVVREIAQSKKSGSGNTLVVRSIQGLAKVHESENALTIKNIASPVRLNKETITIDVQVDDSLKDVANEAIKDWQRALAKHGVTLKVVGKNTASGLAILEADDVTTRAARTVESKDVKNDSAFEMQKLAGLTTFTRKVGIVDLDRDDKLNKSGTFSVNDLKRTKMVVQLNTDAVKSKKDKINVIKHELGHVFGLQHNDADPLMTTYFTDSVFTGEITDEVASIAARNLRGGLVCECAMCTSMRTR